uniref:Uncharacterized protein n=1 Tax=Anopheles minimus TaxID=112268 RepID=A0A182VQQ5_9DIPT
MRRDETYRRITREKVVVRGNTTIRTLDSTVSFLPIVESVTSEEHHVRSTFATAAAPILGSDELNGSAKSSPRVSAKE